MEQLLTQYQGGFRVGWFTGSHPLAKLEASPEKMTLSISPFFFVPREIYEFRQEQVVALEPYRIIPFFIQGLRIHHNVSTYPRHISFSPFTNPHQVYAEILRTGFRPSASPSPTLDNRRIPFRWEFITLFFVVSNSPYFLSHWITLDQKIEGLMVCFWLLTVSVAAALVPRSSWLQSLILKPGRSIKEISLFLKFLSYLGGLSTCVGILLVLFAT